jgi:hypothetical protein
MDPQRDPTWPDTQQRGMPARGEHLAVPVLRVDHPIAGNPPTPTGVPRSRSPAIDFTEYLQLSAPPCL